MYCIDKFIISIRLYIFRAMFPPLIKSIWLYLQYLVVSTQVAAGWCPEWVEIELCRLNTRLTIYIVQFQLIRDTSNLGGHYQIL
jgi:hypothetical protein